MIVYGDPSTQESFRSLVVDLRESLSVSEPPLLDDRRRLLIRAGMLEQALEDAGAEEAQAARALTDDLARGFLTAWRPSGEALSRLPDLARFDHAPDLALTVKVPEGFAFYGLYPESYALATLDWARERRCGSVAVVGVRSIGTSLSAVVASSLRGCGFPASRTTVRPTGHPFAREASVPRLDADWALVVDEGPGLSGSSMASVAEALVQEGFPRERIAFLPGHGGEPGVHASDTVRAWWRETPRYTTSTEALRWEGLSLEAALMAQTDDAARIEEVGDGRWRERVYGDPSGWPAVAKAFERRKLRAVRHDGAAVLWKFVGLHLPGTVLGFAATPWIEGTPLRREDATTEIIGQIGRHVLASSEPPLTPEEACAARARLVEMLHVNAAEAGFSPLPPSPDEPSGQGEPSAGDYRLAPWEWRRRADGGIVKAGRIAPSLDHTIIGRQPLAWDVAGAMVEWGLDDPVGLPPVSDLRFYRAAYAAFRMGMCAMFAGPDEEGERLRRDEAFYRAALEAALGV